MTPELSRRLGRALAIAGVAATAEDRRGIVDVANTCSTWDDVPPEWQAKIEAWEALR